MRSYLAVLFFAVSFCSSLSIYDHHGQGGCAVIEHQRTGVERIMHLFNHSGVEQAGKAGEKDGGGRVVPGSRLRADNRIFVAGFH